MKKNLIFAAFAAVSVLSCSKEAYIPAEVAPVTIQASIADLATKVSFDPTYESLKPTSMALTWADGDQLRVYNHADHTQYSDFALTAGSIGQKTGVFTGTPVTATSYDVEIINGAVAYGTQTQPSDGVTSGLKYLASASDVADLGTIVFDSFSSVLAITAKMPSTEVAAVIKSVDVTANADIFNGGKTLTVAFDTVGDADADGVLHFFATLPEGSTAIPAGTTLLLQFNAPGQAHDVYTRYIELPAGSFTAGKLNTVNVNATQSARHAGALTCDGTTAANAYLIGDKYQMAAISLSATKKYYKLVNDIDMEGFSWTSLNSEGTGVIDLDGNGKTISKLGAPLFADLNGKVANLTISGSVVTSTNTIGILANTIKTAVSQVESVTVAGGSVSCTETSDQTKAAGGLVGEVTTASTLEDCHISNTTSVNGFVLVGGMIGNLKAGTVENCDAACEVSGASSIGGLIGCLTSGTVTGSHATGALTSTTFYTGGLVGNMKAGSVTNCYATGAISNTRHNYAHAGGLIGRVEGGNVEKCHATGNVSSTASHVGGLIGSMKGTINVRKSYATGSVIETNASKGKINYGGLIGYVEAGTYEVSNCYATGSVTSYRYSGGFIGHMLDAAVVTVTNGYTTSDLSGIAHASHYGVFCGATDKSTISCTGWIGWAATTNPLTYGTSTISTTDNYFGQEGTISSHATTLGWDTNVWDLTGDVPTLK